MLKKFKKRKKKRGGAHVPVNTVSVMSALYNDWNNFYHQKHVRGKRFNPKKNIKQKEHLL